MKKLRKAKPETKMGRVKTKFTNDPPKGKFKKSLKRFSNKKRRQRDLLIKKFRDI
jgi:hypothetical protein